MWIIYSLSTCCQAGVLSPQGRRSDSTGISKVLKAITKPLAGSPPGQPALPGHIPTALLGASCAYFVNLLKANASLSGALLCKSVQLLPVILIAKFQLCPAIQRDPQKWPFCSSHIVPAEVPRDQMIFWNIRALQTREICVLVIHKDFRRGTQAQMDLSD